MIESFTDEQLKKIEDKMMNLVLYSHQSRDKEISSLHKEILDRMKSSENWQRGINLKLDEMTHDTEEYRIKVNEHMLKVEPVIKAYEDAKNAKEYLDSKSKSVIQWAKLISAIGVIIASIMYVIKENLK